MSYVLDPATVKKIAYLARLSTDPSPEFLEKYGKELGAILEYMEQLKELDTSGVDPFGGARTITVSALRDDEASQEDEEYQRIRQNIIRNFPNKQGDLLVLPGIFDND
ncbi:MAG: Asp-tRNA(Asn)/Glu-tRNA(Gln) amidotransferase subunit GatC [Patescibacteria group bacterium]